MREKLDKMDNRTLYANLVFTQTALLIVGAAIYVFFLEDTLSLADLFHTQDLLVSLLVGFGFAVFVVSIDIGLMKVLPEDYFDDGGVNERLFRDLNVLQIAGVAMFVAVVEEWLFRAVLQNIIGIIWTSLLFAGIHYRYLRKWVYAILIIVISLGFGLIYKWTGSIWSVLTAHFLIDFTLGIMLRYHLLPGSRS